MHPHTLVAFQDELTKIAKSVDVDKDMSFFERHPKKILGGAALAAGTGMYLLSKGKKTSPMKFSPAWKPKPSSKASPAPKPAPSPKPKAPAKVLTMEEAKARGYPGASPRTSHAEKHPGEDYIQAVREEGKRIGMPDAEVRNATSMGDLHSWKKRTKSGAS